MLCNWQDLVFMLNNLNEKKENVENGKVKSDIVSMISPVRYIAVLVSVNKRCEKAEE